MDTLEKFLLDVVKTNDFDPGEPVIANAKFCVPFYHAFRIQSILGWDNFARGIVAKEWKSLQYKYYLQEKTKDIHAVDKWARMLIKQIIEIYRIMWKYYCDYIAKENEQSYEGRQRYGIYSLCRYLQVNPIELLLHDLHCIDRHEAFFSRSPLDNVLMWKNRIINYLNNKNPGTQLQIPKQNEQNSLKRHFRVTRGKHKRGRPKTKATKKKKNVTKEKYSNKEKNRSKPTQSVFHHTTRTTSTRQTSP